MPQSKGLSMVRWLIVVAGLGLLTAGGIFVYRHWFRIKPLIERRPPETSHVQEPPLIRAAQRGDIAEVRRLIAKGANVNAANSLGYTALMFAAYKAQGAVPDLLSAGVNVNAENTIEGVTALTLACQFRRLEVVKELVEHGANVNVRLKHGPTPLVAAAGSCSVPLVRYLLQNGASVTVDTDSSRGTPLVSAVYGGCLGVATVLINAGADVNARNGAGDTALAIAEDNHDARMVRLLRRAGAH